MGRNGGKGSEKLEVKSCKRKTRRARRDVKMFLTRSKERKTYNSKLIVALQFFADVSCFFHEFIGYPRF